MKMPAIGDSVLFHPSRAETLPEGTILKARVSGVDENGRLSLTVVDDSGQVVSSRSGVIFMQDDRGAVPDSGYAVFSAEAEKKLAPEHPKTPVVENRTVRAGVATHGESSKPAPAQREDKSHSKK